MPLGTSPKVPLVVGFIIFDIKPPNPGLFWAIELTAAFWKELAEFQKLTTAASLALRNADKKVDAMQTALSRTLSEPGTLNTQLYSLKQKIYDLDELLNGNRSKRMVGEITKPTINYRLNFAMSGTTNSTYGPTPTHKKSLEIAKSQFADFRVELESLISVEIPKFEKALINAGAPWVEGQPIPEN